MRWGGVNIRHTRDESGGGAAVASRAAGQQGAAEGQQGSRGQQGPAGPGASLLNCPNHTTYVDTLLIYIKYFITFKL